MDVPGRAAICLKCRSMEREFVKDLENSKKRGSALKKGARGTSGQNKFCLRVPLCLFLVHPSDVLNSPNQKQ